MAEDEKKVSVIEGSAVEKHKSGEGRLSRRFSSASGTAFRRDSAITEKELKRSRSKGAVGSIISIRRTSGVGDFSGGVRIMQEHSVRKHSTVEDDHNKKDDKRLEMTARYMNTYKLESDKPFHPFKVECILKDVLDEAILNLTYDPDKVPFKAKWAAGTIRQRVKEQEYDRYKLVCIVTIGEKIYQDVSSVMRFLWDVERDKLAWYTAENMHVYGSAICFGMYYE